MFDVGFLELLLIGVVALLVVGPERLPKIARTAGMWVGRGRRMLSSVKNDIEQEMQAEELRKVLNDGKLNNPLHDVVEETRHTFSEIKEQTEAVADDLKKGVDPTSADSAAEASPDAKSDNKQDRA